MDKKYFMFLSFLIVITILPGSLLSQSIAWDTTFTNNEFGERIKDLVLTSNKDIIGVGWSGPFIGPEPSMLKFDSLGNFKWFKRLRFDSLENGNFNFIRDVPKENDFFYVGGSSYELGVWNNDFIAKIDTAGDTLWVNKYHYATFYGTTKSAVVLKDKSIITTGDLLTASDYDIIARRVDSLGNTIWETIYNIPGRQEGYDITEMLDGSLIIGGSSDGDNLIMRIGFDGSLIDTFFYVNTANVNNVFLSLLPGNKLLQTGYSFTPVSSFKNFNIFHDSTFSTVNSIPFQTSGTIVGVDSNVVFSYFFNDTIRLRNSNMLSPNKNWERSLGSANGVFRTVEGLKYFDNNSFMAFGRMDTLNNQNYWLAKISGVGEEWIPDRCSYQPPIAGFDYEYNYPVLTLRDTSSGGLKYLDTVYTWQWNTSAGTSGTDDSLMIFFDTALTKTIDIELVIGNWYGCTDTVNQALVLGETGLEVYKELSIKVFPNPASHSITFETNDRLGQSKTIEIFDLQGRLVDSKIFTSPEITIDLSPLSSGLYFYSLLSNGQRQRGKIVKQ
jgi:hypothetical protein